MPQTINIPDVGQVNFPDSMSRDEIISAIQEHILPDHRARQLKRSSLVQEQENLAATPEEGLISSVLKQVGEDVGAAGGEQASNIRAGGQYVREHGGEPLIPLPKPQVSPEDSPAKKFTKGLIQSGVGAIEGAESTYGLMTLGAGGIPGAGPAILKGAATVFGAKSLVTGADQLAEALSTNDPEKGGIAVGDMVAGVIMTRAGTSKTSSALNDSSAALRTVETAPKIDALEPSTVLKQTTPSETTTTEPSPIKPDALEPSTVTKPDETIPQSTPADPALVPVDESKTAPAKWTSATSNESSGIGTELYAGIPNPVAVAKSVVKMAKDAAPYLKKAADASVEIAKDIGREAFTIGSVDDYRKSVLNWSAKLQKSFGEASSAQDEIQASVPDKVRREGITNWIQADGDPATLRARATATSDPKLKAGYEAALDLTPEEIGVAQDVRNAYQALGARGQAFDVLNNFKDNYVTQIWDLGKGPATGSSRTLKDKFRFSKASTFDSFFAGEQANYVPKTKDISELLPIYLHEMNSVIAARQLVQEMNGGIASDGRPLIVPRGVGVPVEDATGKATLVAPKAVKGDTLDYKTLENQPALSQWRWAAQDEAGNPVFLKADMAVHPEAYQKLKNVLGKSAIQEWYDSKTGALSSIPKAVVKGIDMAQSETKKTMLGLVASFHQVQEGTHAIGHRVNPFSEIPKIDLVNNPSHMDAAQHGLMLLPDRASANQFMEGFSTSKLLHYIPGIGKLSEGYSDYLFHEYIPGLKLKTYEAILDRNKGVYESELISGEVSSDDVKVLSAEQTNAAYGHLNYADLARNPTVQHIMRLGLLAPDFLEARGRFAAQAAKGAVGFKSGREQAMALATLAVAQSAAAFTAAHLSGGQWDKNDPFSFHIGNRQYTMRSVPEDITTLINTPRQFIYSRLSPIVGKGIVEGMSGVDWRGQKVTPSEVAKDLAEQPIPLSLRSFLGTSQSSLSEWEQLAGTLGFKIRRYDPSMQLRDVIQEFKRKSGDQKLVAESERADKESLASSDYADIRHALADNNKKKAQTAYDKLLQTKTPKQIDQAMRPNKPLTGHKALELDFIDSLTPKQRETYDEVIKIRGEIYDRYRELISVPDETPNPERNDFSIRK